MFYEEVVAPVMRVIAVYNIRSVSIYDSIKKTAEVKVWYNERMYTWKYYDGGWKEYTEGPVEMIRECMNLPLIP